MNFKSKYTIAVLFLAVLAGLLTLVACSSDAERTQETNTPAASEGQSGDSGQLTGKISVFDLKDGVCFNAPTVPGGESVSSASAPVAAKIAVDFPSHVELVDCSGDWEYRAVKSLVVTRDGSYPGQDFFVMQGRNICSIAAELYLFPMFENWEAGDRVVACLEER